MQRVLVFIASVLLGACDFGQSAATDQADTWFIEDVSVIDVRSGTVLPHQSVVIRGSKISSVGPSTDVIIPDGATSINGSGKFLIPGLWDMHIHTSDDTETRNAILPLLIANGVTGARSMSADCHTEDTQWIDECGPTINDVNKWREEIGLGSLVGPRLVASSFYTEGPDRVEDSSVDNPGTAEHARAYAQLMNDRGVDLVKVYSGLNRDAYFALADEARSLGLEFGGHVPLTVRASEASDAGQSTIEHITGFLEECSTEEETLRPRLITNYSGNAASQFWLVLMELADSFDEGRCSQLYTHLAANGTWHVPTLSTEGFSRASWRDDPRLTYVPRIEVELWEGLEDNYYEGLDNFEETLQPHYEKAFKITGGTYRAGVPMMAGSDAGDYGVIWGFSLHDELRHMVEAGLSDADALRAATLNPAIYSSMEDQLGTIEAGKLADIVLLNANPLEDISNTRAIEMVVANGRVFQQSAIDGLLRNVAAYARSTWEENSSLAD